MIGIISAFFTNIDTKKTLVQKKLSELESICKDMHINDEIADEIKKSTEYSANKTPYYWLDPNFTIF